MNEQLLMITMTYYDPLHSRDAMVDFVVVTTINDMADTQASRIRHVE